MKRKNKIPVYELENGVPYPDGCLFKVDENHVLPSFILIIGDNGVGKTTTIKDLIRRHKYYNPKSKSLVFDAVGALKSVTNTKINSDSFAKKTSKIKNSIIAIDGFELFNVTKSLQVNEMVCYFLINRRHHNNTFIVSCNSISNIPLSLIPYVWHFYIFKSHSLISKSHTHIPFIDLIITSIKHVNTFTKIFDSGMHKDNPIFNGYGFPHMVVNAYKYDICLVNMTRFRRKFKFKNK